MKKIILTAALLLGVALQGHAQGQQQAVSVTIDSVSSTMTVRGVDVTTQTLATSVLISTNPLYRQICIQNFDTTSFVACSENARVSTTTSNNAIGVIIPAATSAAAPLSPLCFSILPGADFYCKAAGTAASVRVGVTRGR